MQPFFFLGSGEAPVASTPLLLSKMVFYFGNTDAITDSVEVGLSTIMNSIYDVVISHRASRSEQYMFE